MTVPRLVEAALVRPAIVDNTTDTTGLKGPLFRADLSGAPAMGTVTLPAGVKGTWVDLVARGCAVQYGFVVDGTTKPTMVFDGVVVAGTGATNGVAGATILLDERVPVEIPKTAKEIVYIWAAATAGAWFEGVVSSKRGT